MAQDLGFNQIVDFPTRGSSVLDLCFTNFPNFIKKCELLVGLGDHDIVRILTSLKPFRKKPIKRKIQLWGKVDVTALKSDASIFRNTFLEKFSVTSNVLDMWTYIKSELNSIITKHVPTKLTSSKFHQPWINSNIKKLIRKKNRWFKKAKSVNSAKV